MQLDNSRRILKVYYLNKVYALWVHASVVITSIGEETGNEECCTMDTFFGCYAAVVYQMRGYQSCSFTEITTFTIPKMVKIIVDRF